MHHGGGQDERKGERRQGAVQVDSRQSGRPFLNRRLAARKANSRLAQFIATLAGFASLAATDSRHNPQPQSQKAGDREADMIQDLALRANYGEQVLIARIHFAD
jgi:hypothetical protein